MYYNTETLSNIIKTNDGIIGLSSKRLTDKNAFSCNFKYQYMSSQNPVWRFIPEYAPKLYFENKSYFFIYFDSDYHIYNKDTDSWVTVDKKSDDGTISDLSSGMDTTIVNNIPYSKIHELTGYNDVAMYCYIKDEKHGDKNVRYIDTIQHKQRNGLVLDIDKYTPEKTYEEENEILTSIINTKPSHSFNIGYCYETEKSADNILNNDEIEIYSSSEKEKTVGEKNIKATMLIDKVTNNFTVDRPYIGDINVDKNILSFSSREGYYTPQLILYYYKFYPYADNSDLPTYVEIKPEDRLPTSFDLVTPEEELLPTEFEIEKQTCTNDLPTELFIDGMTFEDADLPTEWEIIYYECEERLPTSLEINFTVMDDSLPTEFEIERDYNIGCYVMII